MQLPSHPDTNRMSQTDTTKPSQTATLNHEIDLEAHGAEHLTRFVVVEINKNRYGVSTDSTVELMDSSKVQITRVSHAPSYVKGVINHRGSIIPAIDTRSLLGFTQDTERVHSNMMVITEHEGQNIGLIVDEVHAVFDCSDDAIDALPDSTASAEFLRGLVHQDDGSYILIADIETIYKKTSHE